MTCCARSLATTRPRNFSPTWARTSTVCANGSRETHLHPLRTRVGGLIRSSSAETLSVSALVALLHRRRSGRVAPAPSLVLGVIEAEAAAGSARAAETPRASWIPQSRTTAPTAPVGADLSNPSSPRRSRREMPSSSSEVGRALASSRRHVLGHRGPRPRRGRRGRARRVAPDRRRRGSGPTFVRRAPDADRPTRRCVCPAGTLRSRARSRGRPRRTD